MINIHKDRKIVVFCLCFLVLLFSFSVSAEEGITIAVKDIGNFKPNQQVTLVQVCDNCTFVNVTSIYSRSSSNFSLLGQFAMTKNSTVYNYVPSIQFPQGKYTYCTQGDLDGQTLTQCVNFGVGQEITIPMILILLGIILLALGVFSKEYILGLCSGIFLNIAGVYILIYGLSSFNDLYTKTIAYITLFLGLILMFASAYEAFPTARERVEEEFD